MNLKSDSRSRQPEFRKAAALVSSSPARRVSLLPGAGDLKISSASGRWAAARRAGRVAPLLLLMLGVAAPLMAGDKRPVLKAINSAERIFQVIGNSILVTGISPTWPDGHNQRGV